MRRVRGSKTAGSRTGRESRPFQRNLLLSASIHGGGFLLAAVLSAWLDLDPGMEATETRVVRTADVARADFEELVEEVPEPVLPPEPLEEPRLVEFAFDEAPVEIPEEELTDPFGDVFVWEHLSWKLSEAESELEPVEERPQPETKAAEPVPVAVEAVAGGVEEAALLEAPSPRYPRLSIRDQEEGTVLCRIFVAADGSVERVEVVRTSGHRRLDDAAVETLLTWRFAPKRVGGIGVPTDILHPVTFLLRDR